jgi:hypothetical protein
VTTPQHVTEGGDSEHGGGPCQHQRPALEAAHVAGVAGVLVALHRADETAAGSTPEGAADATEVGVAVELGSGGVHEAGVDRAIGVHHDYEVVVVELRHQPVERLVERAGLLVGVALFLEHLGTSDAGERDGRVRAVVGDHDHAVDLVLDGLHGGLNADLFVVHWDQRNDLHVVLLLG